MKAGRWFTCAINRFIDISSIIPCWIRWAIIMSTGHPSFLSLLTFCIRPDDTDETFLNAWSKLVAICLSLQDLLNGTKVTINMLTRWIRYVVIPIITWDSSRNESPLLVNIIQLLFVTAFSIGFEPSIKVTELKKSTTKSDCHPTTSQHIT